MKLKKIEIKNFRSIENATLELKDLVDKSSTYTLPEFGQPQCPPDNFHHLDNNIYLNDHVWEALTDIDVLVLPVDASQHILSYEQANDIVNRIRPHVIIPEHYLTKGASITLTTLGSAEEWVNQQENYTLLSSPTMKLTPQEVRKKDRHVFYFGDNHLTK